jgi:hypothetical protein
LKRNASKPTRKGIGSSRAENALNAIRDAISYLRPQSPIDAQFMLELIVMRADSMLDFDGRLMNLSAIKRTSEALAEWAATQERQRAAA